MAEKKTYGTAWSDGRDPEAHAAAVSVELSPLGTAEILRDRRFQVLACIYGCLFGAGSALIVFIVSFATHLGMSLQSGALFLSGRAITTIVGRNLGGS